MARIRREPRRDDRSVAGSTASQATNPGHPRQEDIAARAYELYQHRGAEHGRDWDDWFTAERELQESEKTP